MNNFIGTYECKIDGQGSLKVSIPLVKQMEISFEESFVRRSFFQVCLEAYPMISWKRLIYKINKLNRFIKRNVDFVRMFIAGVKTVEMDNAARLQVSKDLIQFSDLKKEVVLRNSGEPFEICDKEVHGWVIFIDNKGFSTLVKKVMRSINFENVS